MTASSLLVALICIINTMGIARYWFQWGDPASSPTYKLVPDAYFLFWNLLTALVVIILITRIRKPFLPFAICYLYLILFSIIVMKQSDSFYVHGTGRSLILNGFFFIALASSAKWVNIKKFNRSIEFLAILCIAFLCFQVIQFYMFGVLPSHSHPDYLIRYGGIYDDSLVLAIILPMFVGYYVRKFLNPIANLAICLLGVSISFLTGSYTGILIMLVYTALCMRGNPRFLIGIFFVIAAASVWQFEELYSTWLFKKESIFSHIKGWDDIAQLTVPTLLGISPTDLYPEPGYASLLLNFGVPLLLVLVGVLFYVWLICFLSLNNKYTPRDLRMLFGATEGLLISVALANFNLPVAIFPPVFFMLSILSGISVYQYTQIKNSFKYEGQPE